MKHKKPWLPTLLMGLILIVAAPFAVAQSEDKIEQSPAFDAEPKAHVNTIKWSTASEVENFGFDVFRGDSEDGPFECLTEKPIEGAGTVDEPQHYQFIDDTIDPKRAYYYYVESISLSGVREKFTPVFRAKPKVPADEED